MDDFIALTQQMIDNGDTPLCVGIGTARHGLAVHRLDRGVRPARAGPRVLQPVGGARDAVQLARDRRGDASGHRPVEHRGHGVRAGGSITGTAFRDNGKPLIDGDCMMHRQANFFAAFFPEGTEYGADEGQVDVFYFPGNEGHPTLIGGRTPRRSARRPRGVGRDAVPRLARVRQRPPKPPRPRSARAASPATSRDRRRRHEAVDRRSSRILEILQTGRPGRLRRVGPMPTEANRRSGPTGDALVNGDIDAPGGRRHHRGGLAGSR